MKKISSKQVIPMLFVLFGSIFATIAISSLGFWNKDDGPMPGFFPLLISIVLVLISLLCFLQSFNHDKKTNYRKDEFLVIASAIAIFTFCFFIGLLPSIFLYVVLWLRLFEKESWKTIFTVLIVIAIISIGVFYIWLGIKFPLGIFEYFL